MHVLRDCDDVKFFGISIIKDDIWSKFYSLGTLAWFEWNQLTTLSI